ncbi:MAG: aminotransferase class I/II-fold pyridoxal phosphate-dependent enzyme [Oscillospiraceae bacterium]|jgi:threonine-phosphate decarboxylase|nr:aminotransferase class I/II-fold pyridoxal phosphate-dependent enzyme [Oscillospiraceae bacterium]
MLYQANNPHGGDVYGRPVTLDVSVNTNPLGPPPGVVRAVVDAAQLLDRYPDPHCRRLVAALADREGVPEEAILCGAGAAELIFSFCAALRPRTALELAPTFSEYAAALAAAGCRVERCALEEEQGFALTEKLLEELERKSCEVVFLCNPNNPTGRLIPPALLESILALCERRGGWLFVDECFLELSDGGRGTSLAPLLRPGRRLFLLRAFTKSYAMAGLRLGYCLCGEGALLERMGRQTQPWNVSVPAQAAGLAALGEEAYLRESRALIQSERRYLREGLEALGLTVCSSQANYLLVKSPAELSGPLLDRGILIRDCANYRGLGPGWYRTAVRRREENRTLLNALGEILG